MVACYCLDRRCVFKSLVTPSYDRIIDSCIQPICIPVCCAQQPPRSQRETTVSDENVESYQPPSHQLELPVVLAQDSIASIESVDLEPIPESVA